jgi:hypothetical protein
MKNRSHSYLVLFMLVLLSCGDNTKEKQAVDRTLLIIGSWELIDTTDPQGKPNELVYTFQEDGTFNYRSIVQAGGRASSILDGTWRFTNTEQTQIEILLQNPLQYTIDVLNENTLQLSDESVTITMLKR